MEAQILDYIFWKKKKKKNWIIWINGFLKNSSLFNSLITCEQKIPS